MLSKKSEEFLIDLKIYLSTYGKKEKEIQDIIIELEDHLVEAEKHGKNIDDITGGSPKAYMDQFRDEMVTDKKEVLSLLLLVFPLALSYIILPDAIRGIAAYTIGDIIGYISAFVIGLCSLVWILRFESSRSLSKFKKITLYWIIGTVPVTIFIGTDFINKMMNLSPIFKATPFENVLIIGICTVFLISCAIFIKTWSTIVVPIIIIAPTFIAERIAHTTETQLWISSGLLLIGITLLLCYLSFQNKRENKQI